MPRSLADARRWVVDGTRLCLGAVAGLSDADFDAPSGLDGWSRRHVVAHIAANAEACGRLVQWASTGEPTPMYASAEARAEGIETGSQRSPAELRAWIAAASNVLIADMDALTDEQWHNEIVTGRGRRVEATEIPWMRAREVCLHAVDLAADVSFRDLPIDFLVAQCDDAAEFRANGDVSLDLVTEAGRWRIGTGRESTEVALTLAEAAAYLVGRPVAVAGLPELPPWI